MRKQISIFLDIEDWRMVRYAAAQEKVSVTEWCRRLLRPAIDDLK